MAHNVRCYRCGTALAALTLPLSRQDECPGCGNYLHVCRMCTNFDPRVPRQCREDDADDVKEKERLNFCDWFAASESAFGPRRKSAEERARSELDALFGNGDDADDDGDAEGAAAKLFR